MKQKNFSIFKQGNIIARSLFIATMALFTLGFVACGDDEKEDTHGVSVSPNELRYGAAGGTQSTYISLAGYSYYGASVRSQGHGWCSVSAPGGPAAEIKVTVERNTTGKARECYIDCYAAATADASESEKIKVQVLVVQDSGNGSSSGGGSDIDKEISSITIYGETEASSPGTDVTKLSFGGKLSQSDATFSIKSNGAGAIVTATSFERVRNYLHNLTFEIDDWSKVSKKTAKITTFKLKSDLLQTLSGSGSDAVKLVIAAEVNASNIPMYSYIGNSASWEGTQGDGVKLDAKSTSTTSGGGTPTASVTTTSKSNSANNISVTIVFKDGSKVRLSAD